MLTRQGIRINAWARGKKPMVSELPRLIRPMMATLRHGLPPDEDRYGWEFKWDGVLAVAYCPVTRISAR
jgi:ATP-dependent DNA ligase